jgi:hypothetical protein
MKMARVVWFTGQRDEMSKFYGPGLGLDRPQLKKGWREFASRRRADRAAFRHDIARPLRSEDFIPR